MQKSNKMFKEKEKNLIFWEMNTRGAGIVGRFVFVLIMEV